MIILSGQEPIAVGGKRDVFAHPDFPDRCLKVCKIGLEPEALHRSQPWSRRIRKRMSSFDENHNDHATLSRLGKLNPPTVWDHIPRYFGQVETDRGPAIVVEKICDHGGGLSRSFASCLRENGYTTPYRGAVDKFGAFWRSHYIPARNIIVDNIVLQEPQPDHFKVVLVDGFGGRQFIPIDRIWRGTKARQQKKLETLQKKIAAYVERHRPLVRS